MARVHLGAPKGKDSGPDQPNAASPAESPPPVRHRLAWFAGLWLAGVAALGLVSLAIKLAIG